MSVFLPSPLVGEGGASRSEATGEGFSRLGKLYEDVLQNCRRLLQDIIVPISRDLESLCHQDRSAFLVTCRRCVLTAINFDDEALFTANKIQNEALEWHLATKLESRKPPIAKQSPHGQFCVGRLMAHLFREAADACGDRPMIWCLWREPLTRRRTAFGATLSHKGKVGVRFA